MRVIAIELATEFLAEWLPDYLDGFLVQTHADWRL
jgi:hypothetical protein